MLGNIAEKRDDNRFYRIAHKGVDGNKMFQCAREKEERDD